MNFIYTCVVILIAATPTPGGCQNFKKGDTCVIHVFNQDSSIFMKADATVVSIAAPDESQPQTEVLGINVTLPLENLLYGLVRKIPGVFVKNTLTPTNLEWVRLKVTGLNFIPTKAVSFSFSEYPAKVRCLLELTDSSTGITNTYMSSGIIDEHSQTLKLKNENLRMMEEVNAGDDSLTEFKTKEAYSTAAWKTILWKKRVNWLIVSYNQIPSADKIIRMEGFAKCLNYPKVLDINDLKLEYNGTKAFGAFLP